MELITTEKMIVDEKNLIHGGFTFSLGDHTAMVTINHPYVVLIAANVKFLKPIIVGDVLISEGKIVEKKNSKIQVDVEITKDSILVFTGQFICKILEKHFADQSV